MDPRGNKTWGAFKTVGSGQPQQTSTAASRLLGYAFSFCVVIFLSIFAGFALVILGLGRIGAIFLPIRSGWLSLLIVLLSVASGIAFWVRSVREEIRTRNELERKPRRSIYTYNIRSRAGDDDETAPDRDESS